MTNSDMWATSLPYDLLVDIFRRLGSTASCLRPRPDRFLPDLLLGFLDYNCHLRPHTTLGRQPEYVPSSTATNVLAMESVVGVGPYDVPLASLDGFLLLKVWDEKLSERLCLCNLLAGGSCRFLPIAEVDESYNPCSYVLATAYDDDDDSRLPDGAGGGSSAVRILAVKGEEKWVTYQTFSTTSGVWGPVKRTAKLIDGEDLAKVCVLSTPRHAAVVCGGGGSVVYWLVDVVFLDDDDEDVDVRTCLFAMDTRTERTWTTELPEEWMNVDTSWDQLMLATAEDGRWLSLVAAKAQGDHHQIEVWVLATGDDGRWTLRRTMDMQNSLVPYVPSQEQFGLRCFCPRSGWLLAIGIDYKGFQQHFLVGVDGSPSSRRLIGSVADSESCFIMLDYEMDWSTYISKMKYF